MSAQDYLEKFKDFDLARRLATALSEVDVSRPVRVMHVCGTHEHSIARSGIRSFLSDNLSLVAGPGCPVCVCPAGDIDMAIRLAKRESVIITTFGDMFRVPSSDSSLEKLKAAGRDIRIIYSPFDSITIARDNPEKEVVFLAVGFETTAAPIAAAVLSEPPENFSMITSLRLVPPALRFLLDRSEGEIEGFILPGHVSTIIGRAGYSFLEETKEIPSVIAGFEPIDIMQAIISLMEDISSGPPHIVKNLYGRAVRENGNTKARRMMEEVFQESDSSWRGIGLIPGSGLFLADRFSSMDARERFGLSRDDSVMDVPPGCICHKVILGESEPEECPLFGAECTPVLPVGPCMVSSEGTCRARFIYGSRK